MLLYDGFFRSPGFGVSLVFAGDFDGMSLENWWDIVVKRWLFGGYKR
jgi:hypothetical protein